MKNFVLHDGKRNRQNVEAECINCKNIITKRKDLFEKYRNRCAVCLKQEIVSSLAEDNYTLVSFDGATEKDVMIVMCNHAHEYPVNFSSWKQGTRCPKCAGNEKHDIIFVCEFLAKNGFRLISETYNGAHSGLDVQCEKCNFAFKNAWTAFQQKKVVCPQCDSKNFKSKKKDFDFIKQEIEKYRYKLISENYINCEEKLQLICPEGHKCEISYDKFKQGRRCKYCKKSKGEHKICEYLINKKIDFSYEHTFSDLKFINKLRFDFYIPNYSLCIEFQGEQHYKPDKWPETKKSRLERFNDNQSRDNLKRNYCEDENNNLRLIEICYKDYKKIDEILDSVFMNHAKLK